MWLIDHSEGVCGCVGGRGGGGVCPLPCCMQSRSLLFDNLFDCQIYNNSGPIMVILLRLPRGDFF